jgi:hypothetical protein
MRETVRQLYSEELSQFRRKIVSGQLWGRSYPKADRKRNHGRKSRHKLYLTTPSELGFTPVNHKDGYDPVKNRKVRIAVLNNKDANENLT